MASSHRRLLYRQPLLFCLKLLDPGWKKPVVTKSLDSVFLMTCDAMSNNAHGQAPGSVTRSSQHVKRDFFPPL